MTTLCDVVPCGNVAASRLKKYDGGLYKICEKHKSRVKRTGSAYRAREYVYDPELHDRIRKYGESVVSYDEIAELAGCSQTTVSEVLGKNLDRPIKQADRSEKKRKQRAAKIAKLKKMPTGNELIKAFKEENPCSDCGQYFEYFLMDLDHVRGIKEGNISRMARGVSGITRLVKELEKCDLVCCMCHRKRTQARINGATSKAA